jgi:SAM-dependent methyltransferase
MTPPSSLDDAGALADYLLSFRWPFRNDAIHRELVAGGLPLWTEILRLVPDPPAGGEALELGSPPFHLTLLMQRLRRYRLSLTGCAADGRPEIVQVVESPAYGERHELRCACFDVERDPFPYPDARFDLVTWCEVIEHLTENPVHALAEIHRVLRPGGWLVVSTPNAARAGNIAMLLQGRSVYDPYHLGAPLKGSRHSREYTLEELSDLVAGCGFEVDVARDVDLGRIGRLPRRALRWVMNHVVGPVLGGHHRTHLFLRARRTERPFRWYYPEALFDQAQLAFHLAPRSGRVVMGENDVGHAILGWGPPVPGPDGKTARRCEVGDLYLRDDGAARAVRVVVSAGRGKVEAWQQDSGDRRLLGRAAFDAPAGTWHDVVVPLAESPRPGAPLHVRVDAPGGVLMHAAATDASRAGGS